MRLVDKDAAQPTGIRLLPLLVPVVFAGTVAAVLAVADLAASEPSGEKIAGLIALLAASAFVEAFPLPLERVPLGKTSLATVFIVGTAVLFGWAEAALVALITQLVVEMIRRRPRERIAYNAAVYALAGAAAGLGNLIPDGESFVWLCLQVLAGATAYYCVDLILVAAAVARARRSESHRQCFRARRECRFLCQHLTIRTDRCRLLWRSCRALRAALGPGPRSAKAPSVASGAEVAEAAAAGDRPA